MRFLSNISLKICGFAVTEILPSSCGIVIVDIRLSCAWPLLTITHSGMFIDSCWYYIHVSEQDTYQFFKDCKSAKCSTLIPAPLVINR
jgi:hypothetical protein